MPNLFNQLKQRIAQTFRPVGPAQPGDKPTDEPPVGIDLAKAELNELRHYRFLPSPIPPEGDVFVGDGLRKAEADLTPKERWVRDKWEPAILKYMNAYLVLAEIAGEVNFLFDERDTLFGAKTTKRTEVGKKAGGEERNLDGTAKLTRKFQDRITYDDTTMQRAKASLLEAVEGWDTGRRTEILQIIEITFRKNEATNQFRRADIAKLRKVKSDDPLWQKGIALISEAERVDGSAGYICLWLKDYNQQWQSLPLSIADVRPISPPVAQIEGV